MKTYLVERLSDAGTWDVAGGFMASGAVDAITQYLATEAQAVAQGLETEHTPLERLRGCLVVPDGNPGTYQVLVHFTYKRGERGRLLTDQCNVLVDEETLRAAAIFASLVENSDDYLAGKKPFGDFADRSQELWAAVRADTQRVSDETLAMVKGWSQEVKAA